MDWPVPASKLQALLFSMLALTKFYEAPFPKEPFSAAGDDDRSTKESHHSTHKFFEGLLYSWSFVVWNFLIINLLLLLVFTFLYWGSRLMSWRKRRRRRNAQRFQNGSHHPQTSFDGQDVLCIDDDSSGTLSFGSTLLGVSLSPKTSSPNPAGGERSQLLLRHSDKDEIRWRVPWSYRLRAWLVYQPKSIPFFNKCLPSNHTTIAVLVFIGIELFYTIYNITFSIPMLFVFADRTSVVFAINLPLLYLLAAKNQPLKFLTGYSYESLNIFHRRLGEFMCLLAFLHSAGMVGVWFTLLRPLGITLGQYLLKQIIFLGLGTFFTYELLYLTSLGSFRKKWYEVFLATHIFLQVAALILLWFHHHRSRIPVGIALGIFLLDRLVYRMVLKKRTVRASLEVKDQLTTIVRAKIPRSKKQRKWSTLVYSNIKCGWDPTEHVFLTIPSLSRKYVIQAHPFTIASKASNSSDSESNLELIIRSQDGFTSDLLKLSQGHDEAKIKIDGPYGSQSAVQMLQDCDLPVIIAGGSGIAVAWPLVWSILSRDNAKGIEACAVPGAPERILFIWVVRENSHLTWLSPGSLDELCSQGVDVVIPSPTSYHGHPDINAIVAPWLADHDPDRACKIGVVCSGPDGMNRAVTNLCSSLLNRGWDVNVEIAKFGW